MMQRLVAVAALVIALVVGLSVTPRRAAAVDDLVYIIPAAVGGVVAVIAIVAIVMADRTEPEIELRDAPRPVAEPGIHVAPDCAVTATGRPLLCW